MESRTKRGEKSYYRIRRKLRNHAWARRDGRAEVRERKRRSVSGSRLGASSPPFSTSDSSLPSKRGLGFCTAVDISSFNAGVFAAHTSCMFCNLS